jgi:uncharacterized protein (UPF0333 family)
MKRGQFEMSFGMIFSIILIIIFIAFAFYAITKFLQLQDTIKISQFESNLQSDINKIWKSPEGSQNVEYLLPSQITAVCFQNDSFQNLVFNSQNIIPGTMINNIDIAGIIGSNKQFCVNNIQGKVDMVIKKDYGDALVTITKQ